MAGRPKQGIDYSGWSVDIFDSDPKIDKLLDAKGWKGFGVYFFLCQRAYKTNGYFYEWSYDDCATTARKMGGGINSGTVEETVRYCLQVDLFNQRLFDRWNILTSRGIQRRFWAVLSERRIKSIYDEYWLLESKDCNGLVKVSLNLNVQPTNKHVHQANDELQPLKESKVKKSKEKESKEYKGEPVTFVPDEKLNQALNDFIIYRKNIKKPMTDRAVTLLIEKLGSLSKDPAEQIEILNQSIVNGWQGVFPLKEENRKPGAAKPPAPNNFHNFEQRDTDYDAIVAARVKAWIQEEKKDG